MAGWRRIYSRVFLSIFKFPGLHSRLLFVVTPFSHFQNYLGFVCITLSLQEFMQGGNGG